MKTATAGGFKIFMKKTKIIALVPMRHQSDRVPQKNYRDFNGHPLFYWILATLSRSSLIDGVYINTDSPVIKKKAPLISKKIRIIDRPTHLCSDMVPMNDILLHDVSCVDADYYVQTHSTNPLLKKKTIETAIQILLKARDKDSLFSVTRLQTRLWDKDGRPMNHEVNKLIRTQDLPAVYEENSNIYIFTRRSIEENKSRIGKKPILFEISKNEAWDIDEKVDFKIARCLAQLK